MFEKLFSSDKRNDLPSHIPTSHLFESKDLTLIETVSGIAYALVWKKYDIDKAEATFDVVVRELPQNRNFMVFTGLEEIVKQILDWKFTDHDIGLLKKYGLVDNELEKYFRNFKFNCTIYALKEGTIFFPKETILRITGPMIDVNLLYIYFITAITSNTIFSTKCIRPLLAAQDKAEIVITGGRAHGFESAFKCARSAYICGASPWSVLSLFDKYGFKPEKVMKATMHLFIKSFPSELEAMRAFVKVFPDKESILIVDTFDSYKGIENVIRVCHELKKENKGILALYLDSGEIDKLAFHARKRLDDEGFQDVKIMASSNIDENKIKKFVDKKVPIDSYLINTEIVTVHDDPRLEIVYKMAQMRQGEVVRNVMKLSPGKDSYPGVKQVYRVINDGKYVKDIIGLEDENIEGEKLLKPIIVKGGLEYKLPKIDEIRAYLKEELRKLPEEYKSLETAKREYQIEISDGLKDLIEETKAQMH